MQNRDKKDINEKNDAMNPNRKSIDTERSRTTGEGSFDSQSGRTPQNDRSSDVETDRSSIDRSNSSVEH